MISEPKEEVWFPIETRGDFNSVFYEGIDYFASTNGR